MPKRKSDLSDFVVAPAVNEADLSQIEEYSQFDPHTGTQVWKPLEGARPWDQCRTIIETLRVIPFENFIQSLGDDTLALPALVCRTDARWGRPLTKFVRGHPLIKFIWDNRNHERLTQALSELQPCYWPEWRAGPMLFGRHIWALSTSEQLYSEDELRLVFLDTVDQERRKFERLKARYDRLAASPVEYRRETVPEEVRVYVWRRDRGRCVQCGSNEKLEYDHIIPVSKGGSNTERNIQLLCEPCNRQKSNCI